MSTEINRYLIQNTATAIVLGTYEGANEREALDAMAIDAGYRDYAAVLESTDGTAIECELLPSATIEHNDGATS